MEPIELLDAISKGESSTVQFKERLPHLDDLAKEMIAFSNSEGGIILVGVNDKTGALNGLSYDEIQTTNRQLVEAATQKIFPPINITTETVTADVQNIVVVHIREGANKPYKDRNGITYVKNGSDKRKVVSNDELRRMLQTSGNLSADEEQVENTTVDEIDVSYFKVFIEKKTGKVFDKLNLSILQVLNNMVLAKGERLTLAGLLLFGKNPQKFKPVFSVQCLSFVGNDISSKEYRDSEPPFEGKLSDIYQRSMQFIQRNLRKIQVQESFNSIGELEIPKEVFEELLVNALIHRDYFIQSSIKIFIFENRIEILSPGKLPNTLSVESIKSGTSIVRNSILFSNGRYVLPYVGIGSGIPRALDFYADIEFVNDIDKELFKVVIQRPQSI